MVRDKEKSDKKKLARNKGNDKIWSDLNVRRLDSGMNLGGEEKKTVQKYPKVSRSGDWVCYLIINFLERERARERGEKTLFNNQLSERER